MSIPPGAQSSARRLHCSPTDRGVSSAADHLSTPAFRLTYIAMEERLCAWAARHGLLLMRVSLGVVFLWFGALKFFPGTSRIDALAETTIEMITFHIASPSLCLHLLALWECLIGIGLVFGLYLRATLVLLFLHLPGTFLPLVLMRHVCWDSFPLGPSLIGHYILKNFVLVSGGIVIAGGLSTKKALTQS